MATDIPMRKSLKDDEWGSRGESARTLAKFVRVLSRTKDRDRELLLSMASKMARLAKG